jgi:shikimate kinase
VGVILARRLGLDFVDTDVVLQTAEGRRLQDIVDRDGYLALRRAEERVLLSLALRHHVIATGGSAVYSDAAMRHLHAGGRVVFLDVDIATIESRVMDFSTRGLARRPDQTFEELFAERRPLYLRHADMVVACGAHIHEEVAETIAQRLGAPSW